MRIISSDSDYYDGYMNHDRKDRFNHVWLRDEREIQINKEKLKDLEHRSLRISRNGWSTGYLILAGVVTPYVAWENGGYPYDKKHKYFYDAEQAANYYKRQKKPTASAHWRHRYWGWEKSIRKDLVAFFAPYADRSDLCIGRATPILLIQPQACFYKMEYNALRTCHTDVNLKDMGLSKFIDAPTLYQTLDVFVSNVLINDDMPETPMTEQQKMDQHGFTHKYSFRKEPGKKGKK
jgi:hypothetical protein